MLVYGVVWSIVADTPASVMSLYGGIYLFIYFYGDSCPKLWTPQPNWRDIFVYGDLCRKLWTPQPNWLDIFVCGDLCPNLWTPLLDGCDVLVHGDFRLK